MRYKVLVISVLAFGIFSFKGVEDAGTASPVVAKTLRKVSNPAFKKGEKLTFTLRYGFLHAGEATIEVKQEQSSFKGRKAFHAVGIGRTKGTFDWFFKVRDRYESYVDEEAIIPWKFVRRVNEGGFKINQDYLFDNYANKVDVGDGKEFTVPPNTQDMISAFYAARCLDFGSAKKGDIFELKTFMDNEIYPLKIKYLGIETVKLSIGKFRCMKFVPVVQQGRVFKDEEDLKVWITADKNKIPVRAQAELLVGSIKMDLTKYEGLAHTIAKVNK